MELFRKFIRFGVGRLPLLQTTIGLRIFIEDSSALASIVHFLSVSITTRFSWNFPSKNCDAFNLKPKASRLNSTAVVTLRLSATAFPSEARHITQARLHSAAALKSDLVTQEPQMIPPSFRLHCFAVSGQMKPRNP